ncbi:hypothetical protein P7H16_14360 [Paenibacillus larvae]|nr:hypothetical protein [Paenibacillus larvae]MDT2247871.1 hypothetical protein [Paenibacillus larvae]
MTNEFFMAMIPPATSQQKRVTVVKNKPVTGAARIKNQHERS